MVLLNSNLADTKYCFLPLQIPVSKVFPVSVRVPSRIMTRPEKS